MAGLATLAKNKNIMTDQLPSKTLFRRYDIRGIVDTTLTGEVVRQVGYAFASLLLENDETECIVARDARLSSPEFGKIFTDALLESGVDVIDLGAVPTPIAHFAGHHLGVWNAAVITGSHNPSDYNGIKLCYKSAPLHSEGLQELYARIQQKNYHRADKAGKCIETDAKGAYQCSIASNITLDRKMKVVVDCGNGIAGVTAPGLLRRLGCEVTELFSKPDGNFPNHHPNPSDPKNLKHLKQKLQEGDYDLGLAFDGDGDRIGVMDSAGNVIWPDRLMILFSREILKTRPGGKVVYDVKSSRHLGLEIAKAGGQPVMYSSGHSLIREKVQEIGAVFGGELSGHLFFSDRWYGFDDGLYAAARLLEILSQTKDSSETVFNTVPNGVNTPELTVLFGSESRLSDFMQEFLEGVHEFENARISRIDGFRADFQDGWGLARESHTTPSLSLRFEGKDEASLHRIQGVFKRELLAIESGLKLPF